MIIDRFEELKKWEVSDRIVVLANASAYYTKKEVDDIINSIVNEINKLKNDK